MLTDSLHTPHHHAGSGLTTRTSIPAELQFLQMIRVAIPVALDGSGSDPRCDEDLQLAADELAVALIGSAAPRSDLQMSVTHDATDAHVQMVVDIVDGGPPPAFTPLACRLLAATVDHHQLRVTGRQAIGTLRRTLDSRDRDTGPGTSMNGKASP